MPEETELESGFRGKQGELKVFGRLLERGSSTFLPMVDMGIDCVIDVGNGNYKEIQVKTRTKTPLFQVRKTKPPERHKA